MNRTLKIVILTSLIIPISLCSCATVGIEKAQYTVLHKEGKFEIRRYPGQLVAETIVDADFDQSGNIAFRRLFQYISGNNRTKESIAMTAPVNQQPTAEKIAMTSPVNQRKVQDKYAVSFLMPARYSTSTIPEPLDPMVVIKEIPTRQMAAVRYSGTWSQKKYQQKRTLLEDFIRRQGLTISGEDIFARYDPPFQLWFLRRNEVLFPVE